jgi:ferric-dicitrate binding protein FerR (iron transport regulator)
MSAPRDPDGLISAHLDGALDDAGHQALEAWLLADRAHQRRFLLAVMDHRAMAGALAARPPLTIRTARRVRRRRGLRAASWSGAALAAALLVGVAVLLWPAAAVPGPRLLVAGVAGTAQRLGAAAEVAVDPGRGAALLYDDGTRVELEAGSALTVSGTRVTLRHGRLAADVAHQPAGRPFVIATPNATVTVLGTALDVATDGTESVVAVTRGRVAVERGGDAARVEVGAGERSVVAKGEPLLARSTAALDGRLLRVGAGQAYATLADLPALAPGDVVELQPGTHRGAWRLPAAGTVLRPVTIRGAPGRLPLISAEGLALSGAGPVPRAAVQLEGGHWRIQHLAIEGARNGENAAGIRLVEVGGAALSDCRIARCDQGVDAIADQVTIEDCDIGDCGAPGAASHCRALSLIAGQAVVRGCLLHDQRSGQTVRATCQRLELEANRISGAADGEVTITTGPRPTVAVLSGNLIVSSATRPENSVRFIQVEGGGDGVLHLVGNTCVASDPRIVFIIPGRLAVAADGNIFTGSDRIAEAGRVVGLGNWLPAGAAAPPDFRGSRSGTTPGFRAAAQGDYGLAPDSPCRNAVQGMWTGDADSPHLPRTVPDRLPTRMPAARAQPGSRARTGLDDQGAFADG